MEATGNGDILKLAAITAGTLISAPFILASLRAFFFFGQMSQAIKTLEAGITETKKMVSEFVEEMRSITRDHEGRLIIIEAERRVEEIRKLS